MKPLTISLLLLVIVLLVPGQTKIRSDDDALKASLIDFEKKSWDAWKKRDGHFFSEFLSDDHVDLGVSGAAGKAAVVGFVGSPVCVIKNYAVDNFKATIFDPNTVLLTYHAVQDTMCNGSSAPSPVWVSSLYLKRGGRWLNAAYQQTPAIK